MQSIDPIRIAFHKAQISLWLFQRDGRWLATLQNGPSFFRPVPIDPVDLLSIHARAMRTVVLKAAWGTLDLFWSEGSFYACYYDNRGIVQHEVDLNAFDACVLALWYGAMGASVESFLQNEGLGPFFPSP